MRDNKKSAKLVNMESELLSAYMESVADLNASMTIDHESQTMETRESPIDLAFKSGASFAIRTILIKYFGHTLEELNEKEKHELEGKKV